MELLTSDFEYELPEELIAQSPAERRGESRLLVLDRATGTICHDVFSSIGDHLAPGDLLVANRSRVIPARLRARKETGGSVEILLLRREYPDAWRALARPSRKLRRGAVLQVADSSLQIHVETELGEGEWMVRLAGVEDPNSELHKVGGVPLPPYIHNGYVPAERYQTVYADRDGSVAAPTAGMHFSDDLLAHLHARDIRMELLTLHIGLGTFRPVTAERIRDHHVHPEWGEITERVAAAVNTTRSSGHRVVAVGTTTTRLLETAASEDAIHAFLGDTDRFIYPGYRFQAVDALVTNFHLPRSSLLMLVSAFAGREQIMKTYAEAIRMRYRFYSFGDAMLIL